LGLLKGNFLGNLRLMGLGLGKPNLTEELKKLGWAKEGFGGGIL